MATPAATATTVTSIPWWKEPTRDQWYAFVAAWAGWTLDAFDFTAFLLIIAPIAKEFDVPVPEVAAVLTLTLWMRPVGATDRRPVDPGDQGKGPGGRSDLGDRRARRHLAGSTCERQYRSDAR